MMQYGCSMTYTCNVCGSEFEEPWQLDHHIEDAGHIQCDQCDDTFGSFAALNQHRNAVHK